MITVWVLLRIISRLSWNRKFASFGLKTGYVRSWNS